MRKVGARVLSRLCCGLGVTALQHCLCRAGSGLKCAMHRQLLSGCRETARKQLRHDKHRSGNDGGRRTDKTYVRRKHRVGPMLPI